MLRRDFTKSNKEYFRQNRVALISVALFLIIGIIVFTFFGMNGNFEIKGYTEFTVTVGESKAEDKLTHQHESTLLMGILIASLYLEKEMKQNMLFVI